MKQYIEIHQIISCDDCGFHDFDWCYHPDIQTDEDDAKEVVLAGDELFPDWCPMEDVPDTGEG
jgi:hypothetical protein